MTKPLSQNTGIEIIHPTIKSANRGFFWPHYL
jgi:hypothetical protein